MESFNKSFLALVRLGIGHRRNLSSSQIDWQKIYDLATHQELLGVAIDGKQSFWSCHDILKLA